MTLNNRAKLYYTKLGAYIGKTENWNAFARKRHDLFNVFDFVVILNNKIIGLQVTSFSNMSTRVKKIQESKEAEAWKKAGGVIVVQGWKKIKNKFESREVVI